MTELDKISAGKIRFSLRALFRSKLSVEKEIYGYADIICQLDVDIENYQNLTNFITIYQGKIAIDKFKREKAAAYYKMLNAFSTHEILNAHL